MSTSADSPGNLLKFCAGLFAMEWTRKTGYADKVIEVLRKTTGDGLGDPDQAGRNVDYMVARIKGLTC